MFPRQLENSSNEARSNAETRCFDAQIEMPFELIKVVWRRKSNPL